MNAQAIKAIEKKVARQFPEVSGAKPKISQQKSAKNANFLLTFHGSGEGPGGVRIKRTVRVVASKDGKIVKISTSR